MRRKKVIIVEIIISILFLYVLNCFGFEITVPKNGTVVHPGDEVVVKVSTEPNEDLKGIWFYTLNMKESELIFAPPYEFKFTVHPDFLGMETVIADGNLQNDSHLESKIQIHVVLPSNVVLNVLTVDPQKIFLRKVPKGTRGAHFYEEKQLYVEGLYSDGVVRSISLASSGTKYSSTDENVVTVNSDGLVKAVAPGNARITIRNGSKKIDIDVIVKAKSR
jgi:hypothetical protein